MGASSKADGRAALATCGSAGWAAAGARVAASVGAGARHEETVQSAMPATTAKDNPTTTTSFRATGAGHTRFGTSSPKGRASLGSGTATKVTSMAEFSVGSHSCSTPRRSGSTGRRSGRSGSIGRRSGSTERRSCGTDRRSGSTERRSCSRERLSSSRIRRSCSRERRSCSTERRSCSRGRRSCSRRGRRSSTSPE